MAKQPDNFKKLLSQWNKKLAKSGFNDIENEDGTLKDYASRIFLKNGEFQFGGWRVKAEYYSMATRFLNEYRFSSKINQIIWEYHSNGLTEKEITDILSKVRVKHTGPKTIWYIIKKHRNTMFDMYMLPRKPYRE